MKRTTPHTSLGLKILRISLIVVLAMVALVVLILGIGSLYLTPERLTRIVNREASRYLNADIHARHISYTLWSSFPRLDITTDSITIVSRTLRNLPDSTRAKLPAGADSLASLRSFSGGINVVDLFLNRYVVHDVRVDGLSINLVALNDSINNYNIIPSSTAGMKRVPYFRANLIALKNPGTLSYTSISTDTRAALSLESLRLEKLRHDAPSNSYRLSLGGKVTASSAGLRLLSGFPFSLAGNLRLRFDPFGVELSDYGIDLGEIKSRLSMSVGIGDNPRIESFDYKISSVNLMALLGYLPKEVMPSLQGIKADMQVSASARLTSAWNLSSETFPSMEIDFSIPAGQLDYTLALADHSSRSSGRDLITYPLSYSPMKGRFCFDGKNPAKSFIDIPEFHVRADGLDLGLSAYVDQLTEHPRIAADINLNSDLHRTLRALPIPEAPLFDVSGKLNLATLLTFNVADFTPAGLSRGIFNLLAKGKMTLSDGKISIPEYNFNAGISSLSAQISESASMIGENAVFNPAAEVKMQIGKIAGRSTAGDFLADQLSISTRTQLSGAVTPARVRSGLPVRLDMKAKSISYADSAAAFSASASNFSLQNNLSKSTIIRENSRSAGANSRSAGTNSRNAGANSRMAGANSPKNNRHSKDYISNSLADGLLLSADNIDLSSGKDHFNVISPEMILKVAQRADTLPLTPCLAPVNPDPSIPHSPELLQVCAPTALRNMLATLKINSDFKADRIDILTPGFRRNNYIADIDLSISEDSIRLHSLNCRLKNTRASLSGKISNLRNFLLLPASAENPLKLDLTARLDTININALAKAYVESKGGMKNIPKHDTVTAEDSVTMMVPRNIEANIAAAAKEIIYTNLHLSDLDANIGVKGGVADIRRLRLGSDFGHAALSLIYNSADIQHLSMSGSAALQDFNIVNFFKNFPKLLKMMPEMSNLSGTLFADIDFAGSIFPDMYINMPSVTVGMQLGGRGLTVHQSDFIRKITKMMLIRSDDDIHIKDMDVHAAIHDNLLQLDPFDFEFDRYKLNMRGINNMDGDLYYHVAVMKSPVPFPFSINIQGLFRKPELRFGGERYDVKHAERITSSIQENNNINMMKILKQFMRTFIKHAAESPQSPQSAESLDSAESSR